MKNLYINSSYLLLLDENSELIIKQLTRCYQHVQNFFLATLYSIQNFLYLSMWLPQLLLSPHLQASLQERELSPPCCVHSLPSYYGQM